MGKKKDKQAQEDSALQQPTIAVTDARKQLIVAMVQDAHEKAEALLDDALSSAEKGDFKRVIELMKSLAKTAETVAEEANRFVILKKNDNPCKTKSSWQDDDEDVIEDD